MHMCFYIANGHKILTLNVPESKPEEGEISSHIPVVI